MYISFRFYRSFDEFNSEGEFQRENTKSTVGINDQSEINGKKNKNLSLLVRHRAQQEICFIVKLLQLFFILFCFLPQCVCATP